MKPTYRIVIGDVLERLRELPDESVHCVVTSPPYWGLRDYGVDGQIGLEATPAEFLAKMVAVFREVRRVLRADGTCWVNMGDAYTSGGRATWRSGASENKGQDVQNGLARPETPPGLKPKDLIGMPWRLAFALQEDGWWLRQDIIWAKPNPMPESVTDRCTKAHEYIFLLTKSARYHYDAEAVKGAAIGREPGNVTHKGKTAYEDGDTRMRTKVGLTEMGAVTSRNKRSVWEIATEAFPEAHFATFPKKLVEPCILAGTSERGCCSSCGAPWERVTERVDQNYDGSRYGERAVSATGGAISGGTQKSTLGSSNGKLTGKSETLGWKAGCGCGAELVPCTVMDIFNGSGTTGLVALANRCHYIGIELNPEYAAMSERRLLAATAQEVMAFA